MARCDSPFNVKLTAESSGRLGINNVGVRCGNCYNCKQHRVASWSFRLLKELEVSTSAYFITLTYDTHHVPIIEGRYPMTLVKNSEQNGELKDSEGRSDRSLQAFFKRLRYYENEARVQFDPKVKDLKIRKPLRYYASGEYGSRRQRPHYHIILFNLGYPKSIYKAWATAVVEHGITVDWIPFGQIDIDPDVNQKNIEYTLKYICKNGTKVGKGSNDYRQPEFSLMSKGLGSNFITPQIETFYNRRLDLAYIVNSSGVKISMPRYFANKIFTEETKEDRLVHIKRGVEEDEKKDKRSDLRKQAEKFVRQKKMDNYAKRYQD